MVLLLWQKNGSLLLRRRFFPLSRGGGEKNSKEVSIRRFVPTLALPLLFPPSYGSTEIKDFHFFPRFFSWGKTDVGDGSFQTPSRHFERQGCGGGSKGRALNISSYDDDGKNSFLSHLAKTHLS